MSDNNFILKNARRPGQKIDVVVIDGCISAILPAGTDTAPYGIPTSFDADGALIFPSFIDAHVHLREPGFEYKEDIKSGLTAALHGGFGAIMPMANTSPVNDNAATTRYMLAKAEAAYPYGPKLFPIGALSVNLAGKELAPIGELAQSGAVAISNDGKPVQNSDLFRHAVEYASTWQLPVIDHCEDIDSSAAWQMNEGSYSADLGLKGQSGVGEAAQVARDILLAEYLQLPIHLAHVSSAQSVELIRWAKARSVPVSAETCPHYLTLNDSMLSDYDTNYKMSPPLRSKKDVEVLRAAVADGTIDILATDHAPHAPHEKDVPFDEAPFGIIGLETAVAVSYSLVRDGVLSLERFEDMWLHAPARIFNIKVAALNIGDSANFFLFNPDAQWTVTRETIHSKSLNTPWLGRQLCGKVTDHWLEGVKLL